MSDCTVCGRPILVMINRNDGVCSEICRKESLIVDAEVHDADCPERCWCGMDHSRMDMDQDGNWYEMPDEDDEDDGDAP